MKRQAKKNGTDMCSNTNKRLKTLIEAKNPLFDFISPTSSLESLIQPFNSKTFLNDYWEKKPLVNLRHGALTKHQHEVLSSIYSTQVLEEAAKEKRLLFGRDFHACRFDGEKTVDAVHAKGTLTSASLKKLLHGQKCTFQIHQPQRYSDLLWRLLEHLESYFGCLVGSNVYITPPGTQGLAPHYDDVEVFILQLEGSKHWKLYKPQVELASLVVRTDSWNADKSCHSFTAHWFESDLSRGREAIACLRFVGDHDYTAFAFQLDGIKKEHYLLDYVVNLDPESLGNPIEEFTLRPGDFLYFPRGTIHQACADEGNQFSTHITISTYQHQEHKQFLCKICSVRNFGNSRF
ncbi:hypothetical protein QYM36_007952 [Artemia franciscana]|uniref:Bifunctional lysine-specific demethylase and histidyl-hydroxylase n=1 Tax=Artemia franciscana TaxID=6661 RepID=A0AA88IDH6_ARTSF|nr:hypothetical protein QYM36_007952 [Artemia franciscana]